MMNITSLFLALAMSLSMIPSAFSNNDTNKITSGEMALRAEIRLNNEIDETVSRMLGLNIEEDFGIDYNIKYNASPDYKNIGLECGLSMGSDYPRMMFWSLMDFSDEENPLITFIMKPDEQEKYMYFDTAKVPDGDTDISAVTIFSSLFNPSNSETVLEGVVCETFPVTKDGKSKLILDQNTILDIVKNTVLNIAMDIAYPIFGVNFATVSSEEIIGGSGDIENQVLTSIEDFFDKLSGVKLFADDAFVLETVLDENQNPKTSVCSINIATNIVDLYGAFDVSMDGISKENAEIDLSIILKFEYNALNEEVQIDLPALTDENSINMLEHGLYSQPSEELLLDANKINILFNGRLAEWEHEPVIINGSTLISPEPILGYIAPDCLGYAEDGGQYRIVSENAGINLDFRIGSDIAYINGEEIKLSIPVTEIDGGVMIPLRSVAEALGLKVTYSEFSENDSGCVIKVYGRVYTPGVITVIIPDDCDSDWFNYLDEAAYMHEYKMEIMITSAESASEKTQIMIAAGEPALMIGKYGDEFLQRLIDANALLPLNDIAAKYAPRLAEKLTSDSAVYAIPLTDEYSFIIPATVRNAKEMMIVMNELCGFFETSEALLAE